MGIRKIRRLGAVGALRDLGDGRAETLNGRL
jgi:hypothetical protein